MSPFSVVMQEQFHSICFPCTNLFLLYAGGEAGRGVQGWAAAFVRALLEWVSP